MAEGLFHPNCTHRMVAVPEVVAKEYYTKNGEEKAEKDVAWEKELEAQEKEKTENKASEKKEFVPAETIEEAKQRLENITGSKVKLKEIGIDGANMILNETEQVFSKFPELKKCVSVFKTVSLDSNTGGETEIFPAKGEKSTIKLNYKKFGDKKD